MQNYAEYVEQIAALTAAAARLPLGQPTPTRDAPAPAPQAPLALLFSPHPDDECITGLLPLRLMREAGWRIMNVPVTYGSLLPRRAERHAELAHACNHLGWQWLERTTDKGNFACQSTFDPNHTIEASQLEPLTSADVIAILQQFPPDAIFLPHDADWNARHISTHNLVIEALQELGPDFQTIVVETEFWGAMSDPNFMVEGNARQVTDLVTATACHVKEVARNPYHILLPAWMLDNVRRGGELVGGQGQAAPNFTFATLYRVRRWQQGHLQPLATLSRFCAVNSIGGPLSSFFL